MLAITSREQRHNGLVITSKIGFCSSVATRRARARRPVESATLRISNEGPRTGMDGTGRELKEINLEISSLLADSEFMANAAVFVIVCPPRSPTSKLTREAPETWSSLLKSWRPSFRVNRVGKLHNHSNQAFHQLADPTTNDRNKSRSSLDPNLISSSCKTGPQLDPRAPIASSLAVR